MRIKPMGSITTEMGVVFCAINSTLIQNHNTCQRIHLIPVDTHGMVQGVDGRHWRFNGSNIKRNASNSKTDIPVDYHHASLDAIKTGAKAPAAGWIDPITIEIAANGVWAVVWWTTRALASIRNREYRYLSPVFTHSSNGEIISIKGAALTHYPNLDALTPVANSKRDDHIRIEPLTKIEMAMCSRTGVSQEDFLKTKQENSNNIA